MNEIACNKREPRSVFMEVFVPDAKECFNVILRRSGADLLSMICVYGKICETKECINNDSLIKLSR
jgi:hypothetical protein